MGTYAVETEDQAKDRRHDRVDHTQFIRTPITAGIEAWLNPKEVNQRLADLRQQRAVATTKGQTHTAALTATAFRQEEAKQRHQLLIDRQVAVDRLIGIVLGCQFDAIDTPGIGQFHLRDAQPRADLVMAGTIVLRRPDAIQL